MTARLHRVRYRAPQHFGARDDLLAPALLSSVIFFILEFDMPVDGLSTQSSEPLPDALRHIDAPS
jgi:hypothetical protein